MATIANLHVKLSADTAALVAGLNRAEQNIQRFVNNAKAAGGVLLTAFGATTLLERIHRHSRETLNWAKDIEALGKQLNISTDFLQQFQHVGAQAGVNTEVLAKGLEKAQENLAKFALGEKSQALQQFGLSAKEAAEISSNLELGLPRIAERLRQFDRPSRVAIADAIFGKSAEEFLPILEKGAAALERMLAKARELQYPDQAQIGRSAELARHLAEIEGKYMVRFKQYSLEVSEIWVKLLGSVDAALTRLESAKLPISLALTPAEQFAQLFPKTSAWMARRVEGVIGEGAIPTTETVEQKAFREGMAALEAHRTALVRRQGDLTGAFGRPDGQRRIQLGGTGDFERDQKALADIARQVVEVQRLAQALGGSTAAMVAAERANAQMAATAKLSATATQEQRDQAARLAGTHFDLNRNFRDAQRILEEIKTPQEQYNEQVRRLNELWAAGLIPNAERYRQAMAKIAENSTLFGDTLRDVESIGRSAFHGLASALLSFGDTSTTVWERLRSVALNVLDQIISKMLEISLLNPLLKAVPGMGGGRPTIFSIWNAIIGSGGGGVVDMSGNIIPAIASGVWGMQHGGSFTVGGPGGTDKTPIHFMATRGERVTVETAEQQRRGAGTVNLYGRDNSTVELAEVKAMLRSLGMRVNHMDATFDMRAVGAVVDTRRRGGAAADFMGG